MRKKILSIMVCLACLFFVAFVNHTDSIQKELTAIKALEHKEYQAKILSWVPPVRIAKESAVIWSGSGIKHIKKRKSILQKR